jgi:replicative DNA helicase
VMEDEDTEIDYEQLAEMRLMETMLGSAMRHAELAQTLVACGFSDDDCGNDVHRAIWRCLMKLHGRSAVADHRIVETMLIEDGVTAETARSFIDACMRDAIEPESTTLAAYVENVKQRVARRRLMKLALSIQRQASRTDIVPAEVVATATSDLEAILRGAAVMRTLTGRALSLLALEAVSATTEAGSDVLSIGVPAIDNAAGGAPRGGITLIAAQRKTGKTTLAKHIGLHCARAGERVLHLTFEAQTKEISRGWAEIEAGVKVPHRALVGDMTVAARSKYEQAAVRLESLPLYLERLVSPTAEEVASLVYAYVRKHRIGLVLGDFIQKIQRSTNFRNDEQNHAHISDVLTTCAEKLPGVAFVYFSQTKSDERQPNGVVREHDDPVPQTQRWAQNVYLLAHMRRNSTSTDPALRDLTRLRLVFNRVTGKTAECFYEYDDRTARMNLANEAGQRLDAAGRAHDDFVDGPDA